MPIIRTSPASRTQSRYRILYALAAWIYLVGLFEAELATLLQGAVVGFLFFSGLLLLLVLHASREANSRLSGLLLGIALVAATRIASFSVPPASFPPILWLLLVIAALFGGVRLLQRTLKLTDRDIGLTLSQPWIQFGVALSGIAIGLVQVVIINAGLAVGSPSLTSVSLVGLIALISQSLLDELLFRGLLQRVSRPVFGMWSGFYVALLYTTVHMSGGSPFNLLFIFIVAFYYSLVRGFTGSIVGVACSHFLANLVLFVVLATGIFPG